MGIRSSIKKIPLLGPLFVSLNKKIGNRPIPVHGKNNVIQNLGMLDHVTFNIIGNNNLVEIGENTVLKNTLLYIRGDNHKIIIKNNCYYGGGELWMEDQNGSLIIQQNTTIEHAHLAVTEPYSSLEIREDCMLANNIQIRTGDSHSIIDVDTGKRINKAANVLLETHVWIGADVKILKGVTIGKNSIIGTSSVVTRDIPSGCVAAGIPARVIRSGVDWTRERTNDE